KLEDGVDKCPLCGTKVLIDEKVIPEKPFFPIEKDEKLESGMGKQRKAIFEVSLLLSIIAEAVIALSIEPNFVWFPLLCVFYAEIAFIVAFTMPKPNYFKIASWEVILLMGFLVAFDYLMNNVMSWSYIACISLWLYWTVAVFPFVLTKKKKFMFIELILSLLAFLVLLDYDDSHLSWSLVVGFPVILCLTILSLGFIGLLKLPSTPKPRMTDYVYIVFIIVCFSIGFGDFASTGYSKITWSRAFWFVGIGFLIYEIVVLFAKNIRRFFYSENRHE
ncbi:MAG: hypothetical protein PHD05_02220, partial [Sphaerochaetaceae bacterium]|nr:hypothetical protein [Sphaerochaetaceae bacterium]